MFVRTVIFPMADLTSSWIANGDEQVQLIGAEVFLTLQRRINNLDIAVYFSFKYSINAILRLTSYVILRMLLAN